MGDADLISRTDTPGAVGSFPRMSSSGIGGGGGQAGVIDTVSGITHVIGSGTDDRIYVPANHNPVSLIGNPTFDTNNSFPDTHTLRIGDGNVKLRTGQAVLYEATGEPINGLVSGTIYYVEVNQTANQTDITFYHTPQEINKIGNTNFNLPDRVEIGKPIGASGLTHQLFEVFGATGDSGKDVLISPLVGHAGALLGEKGDDVLVGNNESDFLDGGDGEDRLFGDGSHAQGAGDDDGRDTVLGGKGDDHVFGYIGPDLLLGGAGADYLVGGAGSDKVDGGAGDDTLAIIETGSPDDYDRFLGGSGGDIYDLKGTWGVVSIKEKSGEGTKDTIDLSASSQNYVHVLSDSQLYSTAGTLFNIEFDRQHVRFQHGQGGRRDVVRIGDAVG